MFWIAVFIWGAMKGVGARGRAHEAHEAELHADEMLREMIRQAGRSREDVSQEDIARAIIDLEGILGRTARR